MSLTLNRIAGMESLRTEKTLTPDKWKLERLLVIEEPKVILANLGSFLFFSVMFLVVYLGWNLRGREYLTAESGVGYVLGIIGACLMVLLMVYPIRKRVQSLKPIGSVKFWFKFHMLLGVVGPVCILFHANFQLGSTNSRVALFSMLIVASSGMIGRYFYKRIHYGLFGRRAKLEELRELYDSKRGELDSGVDFAPEIAGKLVGFSDQLIKDRPGFFKSFLRATVIGINLRFFYWQLGRLCQKEIRDAKNKPQEGKKQLAEAKSRIWAFLSWARKTAEFSFYEQVFSMWHVLHLPLFVMLMLSGVFHVFAVHAY